jgi:hypothetical protein
MHMKLRKPSERDKAAEKERLAAIEKLRGMFPNMISSDEFAKRKQEEIDLEERRLTEGKP